jgi:hypothetical protein
MRVVLVLAVAACGHYVPDALFGDADCGNEGKVLDCTFTQP